MNRKPYVTAVLCALSLLLFVCSVNASAFFPDVSALRNAIRVDVGNSQNALSLGFDGASDGFSADNACAGAFAVGADGRFYIADTFDTQCGIDTERADTDRLPRDIRPYGDITDGLEELSTVHCPLSTETDNTDCSEKLSTVHCPLSTAIKVYDNSSHLASTVSIENGISSLAAIGDTLYALTFENTVTAYDTQSGAVKIFEIPDGILTPSLRGIIPVGQYLAFVSYDKTEAPKMLNTESGRWSLSSCIYSVNYSDEGICRVTFDGVSYIVPCEEHGLITPLGVDAQGNIIVEYNFNGISYRKYTRDGNLLGCISETYSDQVKYIGDIVRVYGGRLYRACCDGECYRIDEVKLDSSDVYICADDEEPVEAPQPDTAFEEPSFDGQTAIDKALSMINLEWRVLYKDNVRSRPNMEITVPNKFRGRQLRECEVGKTFTGIPYCLGGMCGTETVGDEERQQAYKDLIEMGYTTGNVFYKGSYKKSSAGVDCSGFLSICYGLSEKRQSEWFYNSYGHTLACFSELKAGDYLVRYDDERHHVMLVCEPPENDTAPIVIAESTMQTGNNGEIINGTVQITRPYSYYKDFVPKTPWHAWTTDGEYVVCAYGDCSSVLGMRGDANCDGRFNTADASHSLKYNAGMIELDYPNIILADVNSDGRVIVQDTTLILKRLVYDRWEE